MRVTELSDNEKLARQAIIATPLPTQQPVTPLGLSGMTLSWWKHYILTNPFPTQVGQLLPLLRLASPPRRR